MKARTGALLAAGILVAIGLFSLVMSLLAENDRWPLLPPGALRGVDLVAGFVVALVLIFLLARKKSPSASD